MAGRPPKEEATKRVEVQASPKLLAYLDDLIGMEGFGDSRPEIVRRFAWDRINELIKDGRLKQK
jgi:hypothetical protein